MSQSAYMNLDFLTPNTLKRLFLSGIDILLIPLASLIHCLQVLIYIYHMYSLILLYFLKFYNQFENSFQPG